MPNDRFTGISDADLQTEVLRRQEEAAIPPKPLAWPNFAHLTKTVTDCVKDSVEKGYENEDNCSYIEEAALKAVYGEGYFVWRRAQKW